MSMVGFPLLLIPLAICNIIVFLMPGVSFSATLFVLTLVSGVAWTVTLSDVLLALGIVLLLFEIIKGARPGAKYFTDHFLSLIVFGGAAAEFLLLPQFGTSTYFLLVTLALVDFLSGIGLRTRRPARVPVARSKVMQQRDVDSEPQFDPAPVPAHASEPAPAPSVPTAESVLLERPEPEPMHSETGASTPSREVQSPGIQPGSDAHPSPDTPPR